MPLTIIKLTLYTRVTTRRRVNTRQAVEQNQQLSSSYDGPKTTPTFYVFELVLSNNSGRKRNGRLYQMRSIRNYRSAGQFHVLRMCQGLQ